MKKLFLGEDGKQYETYEEALKADEEFKRKNLKKKELQHRVEEAEDRVAHLVEEYNKVEQEVMEELKKAKIKAEEKLKNAFKNVVSGVEYRDKVLEESAKELSPGNLGDENKSLIDNLKDILNEYGIGWGFIF